MNLQTQYNLIKEGKGDKQHFLKSARIQFPTLVTNLTDYATSVSILTSKQIITEGVAVEKSSANINWFDTFKQSISEAKKKKDEEEVSKEVKDIQKNAFDSKDTKNLDNLNFNELLHGFYVEMGDEKNKDKSVDEIKQIAAKNLSKDPCFYTKDGMFGVKGVGFTDKAPSLGEPKEPKGEHKSSGYGDIKEKNDVVKNSINIAKATSKTTGLKAPLKESLSPSQKKAMKDKWKLSDAEIEERERWNEQIKKGEKTIQDYRNSELGKKMEKVMNPMLKESLSSDEIEADEDIYNVIKQEVMSEFGLVEDDMGDEDNEDKVYKEVDKRFEEQMGREPVFLSGLHDNEDDKEINENYDEIEALEQELMAEKDPEKKAEIETRLLALQGSLEESQGNNIEDFKIQAYKTLPQIKDKKIDWRGWFKEWNDYKSEYSTLEKYLINVFGEDYIRNPYVEDNSQSLREQIKAIIKETVDINKVKSTLAGLNCKFLEGNNKETEVRYEYWKKLPEDKIKQLEALGYTVEFRDLDADSDTKPQFVNVIKEKSINETEDIQDRADAINAFAKLVKTKNLDNISHEYAMIKDYPDEHAIKTSEAINIIRKYLSSEEFETFKKLRGEYEKEIDPAGGSGLHSHV